MLLNFKSSHSNLQGTAMYERLAQVFSSDTVKVYILNLVIRGHDRYFLAVERHLVFHIVVGRRWFGR